MAKAKHEREEEEIKWLIKEIKEKVAEAPDDKMPHKGYKKFVESEVGADNHHDLEALKIWKKNL